MRPWRRWFAALARHSSPRGIHSRVRRIAGRGRCPSTGRSWTRFARTTLMRHGQRCVRTWTPWRPTCVSTLDGWQIAPEVSFNFRGERGVIDILAWHAASMTLLVIDLKTEVVDISELMGTLDRKTRLAPLIARERGWHPVRTGVWLIVADSSMNRRRVQRHVTTLRAALPGDTRRVAAWLRQPDSQLRCLSFWANDTGGRTNKGLATPKRIRRPPSTTA